jgi:exopolyphosphatase/guanosine-5'-triphosphate,3'-diphosphate pyrophosphatase
LGEGLSQSGSISQEGINRTLEALKKFQEKAKEFQVDRMEAYATAWARLASNTDEMLVELSKMNLPVWILTGEEEAFLSYEAVRLMKPDFQLGWILDLGGGSSEVIFVRNEKLEMIKSFSIGAVSFTEKFLNLNPPYSQLPFALKVAKQIFQQIESPKPLDVAVLGGTAAGFAGLQLKLQPNSPDFFQKAQGLFLESDAILETLTQLSKLSLKERKTLPGMEPERADILIGGGALLWGFLSQVKAKGCYLCLYSFIHGMMRLSLSQGMF